MTQSISALAQHDHAPLRLPLKSIQIIGSLANEAAGPSYSVRRLAEALAERGVCSDVFSLGKPSVVPLQRACSHVFAADYRNVPMLGSILPSRGLREALNQAAEARTVLHMHGLWRMLNVYPGWIAERKNVPLVLSPRGMLAPAALQYSRWQKRVFWSILQRSALHHVRCMHATSKPELEDIRNRGLTQPVALIPNGIDVPAADEVNAGRTRSRAGAQRTLLQLGRLHPQKRIDRLIDAWARLEPSHPDWKLRIVGPSEGGYGEKLKARSKSLGLARVTFEEPLFGAAKEAAYRDADLFVLATENENFGMVIAEALANGTAVVATKGAPWPGIVERRCGWWVDHGIEPLTAALAGAMAHPTAALEAMGARGRAWMLEEFSWQRVAAEMETVYYWCLGEAEKPKCVVTAA